MDSPKKTYSKAYYEANKTAILERQKNRRAAMGYTAEQLAAKRERDKKSYEARKGKVAKAELLAKADKVAEQFKPLYTTLASLPALSTITKSHLNYLLDLVPDGLEA